MNSWMRYALLVVVGSSTTLVWATPFSPGEATGPGAAVLSAAIDLPVEVVLARLSKSRGLKLTCDAPVGQLRVTVGAGASPLSDLMSALTAVTGGEWDQTDGGQFRLRSPSISSATVETSALVARLDAASPIWMRSGSSGRGADPRHTSPPVNMIYRTLRGGALDSLEEGGDVAYARLPAPAQAALTQYVRESAAAQMRAALRPAWLGVAEARLGIRFSRRGGNDAELAWELIARTEGGPWQPLATIPYQPASSPPATGGASPRGEGTLADAAVRVAERMGIGVVIGEGGELPARQPTGDTAEELLTSLLPEGGSASFFTCSWKREGKVFWLEFGPVGGQPVETAERARSRRLLRNAVPTEYRRLIDLNARERKLALGAMWTALWQMLTPEQRTVGQPLPLSALTGEQRARLRSILQAQMVERAVSSLEEPIPDDLRGGSVSLDFELAGTHAREGELGMPRLLRVRQGERVLLMGEIDQAPLILRRLRIRNPLLQKRVDLAFQDEPLHKVVARVSEALNSVVAVEEPEQEIRLTGEFRGRPLLLVLHWIERRTGLIWCHAAGSYVLSAPLSIDALTRDLGAVASVLSRGVKKPPELGRAGDVANAVTEQDRAMLRGGEARLSELSPALRAAVGRRFAVEALTCVEAMKSSWETLRRLPQAQIKLSIGPDGQRFLQIEVPGLPAVAFPVPTRNGAK